MPNGKEEPEEAGSYRCERCGVLRSAASGCTCGRDGAERIAPQGWDPELTRSARPRLRIVLRPEQPKADPPA
ncbi:MAG TPA: hypothetical protein VEP73_08010 [Actinomycetota bacterium]|nr:hypothetical protein [Actinomycetota bacterium]